jgi:UDP-2,3-diacylglucosamine pyrophosphatase LpxH
MDKLDQIHVVSDLHLGGAGGRQVFNQGRALAAVVDHLARAEARRVGLVLNGDIVDFLAADDAKHFDAEGAPRKLQAIFDDEAFSPVWEALGRFVRAEGRLLVLAIGNHDIELALPNVQAMLVAHLTGGDEAAKERLRVAMDGEGYTCLVGGLRTLVIHGNDKDPWNVVDHERLRAFSQVRSAAEPPSPPTTNAGTRLVVDVMNEVKRSYPFVDLLKPETVPVPGVLAALPASTHAPLLDFAKIAMRFAVTRTRMATGLLGAEDAPSADGYEALEQLLRSAELDEPEDPMSLLERAEADFAGKRRAVDLAGSDDEMLGFRGLLVDRVTGRDPRENLRTALAKYLANDRTFAVDKEDQSFVKHDESVDPDVRFIVTGHTHLERFLRRKRTFGAYYNSGTWIRLIQLRSEVLASKEAFAPVYEALSGGTLADLDAMPGLVIARRTVVSIWSDGGSVHAELRHALSAEQAAAVAPSAPWEAVPDTRFTLPSVETA